MSLDFDIRGVLRTSMLDFPGKLSCVVFTNSCNFRCPFCYNPELALGKPSEPRIPVEEFFSFLESKKKWLQGVAITGGEPTLQPGLLDFCSRVKDLGFEVKLDSNGGNPSVLKKVFSKSLADYVAMDVKAPKNDYSAVAGVEVDSELIEQSISLIINSAPDYEFRTTVIPEFISEEKLVSIGKWISSLSLSGKPKRFFLQQFKSDSRMIDRSLENKNSFTPAQLTAFAETLEAFFGEVGVRGI